MEDDDISIDIESLDPTDKVPLSIPELRIGTYVYINNKEHPMNLEQGEIIERDHKHYRVKLISTDPRLNGRCMWFPDHWVEPLPKEFKK